MASSLRLQKVSKFFLRLGKILTLATDFALIKNSQEKDLNNLVAARKHQKNPENSNCFSFPQMHIDEILSLLKKY